MTIKRNVYTQRCHSCGLPCLPLEGRLVRDAGDKRWLCFHAETCPTGSWWRFAHPYREVAL